jgi:hypothetical protein
MISKRAFAIRTEKIGEHGDDCRRNHLTFSIGGLEFLKRLPMCDARSKIVPV